MRILTMTQHHLANAIRGDRRSCPLARLLIENGYVDVEVHEESIDHAEGFFMIDEELTDWIELVDHGGAVDPITVQLDEDNQTIGLVDGQTEPL